MRSLRCSGEPGRNGPCYAEAVRCNLQDRTGGLTRRKIVSPAWHIDVHAARISGVSVRDFACGAMMHKAIDYGSLPSSFPGACHAESVFR